MDALGFAFIGNDQQVAAFGTGLFERSLPGGEITVRVIFAAEEGPPFARFPLDQLTAVLGTRNTNFFQPGFRITTGRKVRA